MKNNTGRKKVKVISTVKEWHEKKEREKRGKKIRGSLKIPSGRVKKKKKEIVMNR